MFSFTPSARRKGHAAHYSLLVSDAEDLSPHSTARPVEPDDNDENDISAPPMRRPSNQGTSYFDHLPRLSRPTGTQHQARDDDGIEHNQHDEDHEVEDNEDENEDEDEDEDGEVPDTSLLPIFSAAHLDKLPLYNITHAIRLLIVQKCETTLSWDQLRSPQISQFLVKPIQNQIRESHFTRATLCALIANNLQFQKEGHSNPGNVGVSTTRALISELLAMRLIKEFTALELIDALSYDFDPLQGMTASGSPGTNLDQQSRRAVARGARVSTIEVAIRAQAKRFLAHAMVVQHLEAIWAGAVVFHSDADNLHRQGFTHSQVESSRATYGTIAPRPTETTPNRSVGHAGLSAGLSTEYGTVRRSITLYNPRDASIFKLSRLRVPRYRQILTTLSFATMLGLFIAVLVERSSSITALEVVFWFWLAGYMLDEIVGFTEQGFGLYILSFWNAFDLGILLFFIAYLALRLYGIVLADQHKPKIAHMAFDVLASTAVLLFPRLFSILDHYRYFSQLLIAFRLMAVDLIAVLILILISCSGFFVAFTLSFSDSDPDAGAIAYALFQILMGFTPAAWERWDSYNTLGRAILIAFLVICHFLIVTILITVLTNSFMAVVHNANEEHQFLFAINTISMVKSDALFSYIAPTNVLGWLLSPLRFLIPFRQYVRINRYLIKISHFPVLLFIFVYERVILAALTFEPTDLIEKTAISQNQPAAFALNKIQEVFSPGHRLREPSVISFHKDRALNEVFRRPFIGSTLRSTMRGPGVPDRRDSSNVDKWMRDADEEGGASPPMEQPRSVLEKLEQRRPPYRHSATSYQSKRTPKSRQISTRSVTSDPDRWIHSMPKRPQRIEEETDDPESNENHPQETDADGDDESDNVGPRIGESALSISQEQTPGHNSDADESEYYHTPTGIKTPIVPLSHAAQGHLRDVNKFSPRHVRQASNTTILFAPNVVHDSSTSATQAQARRQTLPPRSAHIKSASPKQKSLLNVPKSTKGKQAITDPTRPGMPSRQNTAPTFGTPSLQIPRQPSLYTRALDLASEIGDNKWGPSGGIDAGGLSGMPASFSEQILRERELERKIEEQRRRSEEEEKGMVNRIMLARMHTLEEGFREVLREIKDMSQSHANSSRRDSETDRASNRLAIKPRFGISSVATAASSQSASQHSPSASPRASTSKAFGPSDRKKPPRRPTKRPTSSRGKEPTRAQELTFDDALLVPDSSIELSNQAEERFKENEPRNASTALSTPDQGGQSRSQSISKNADGET